MRIETTHTDTPDARAAMTAAVCIPAQTCWLCIATRGTVGICKWWLLVNSRVTVEYSRLPTCSSSASRFCTWQRASASAELSSSSATSTCINNARELRSDTLWHAQSFTSLQCWGCTADALCDATLAARSCVRSSASSASFASRRVCSIAAHTCDPARARLMLYTMRYVECTTVQCHSGVALTY
jgi:hypothetical protein